MKKILSAFLCIAVLISMTATAFAAGAPNIDTGGGGLGNGSKGNMWYGDSGVRVTIVDAESRRKVTSSIDLIKPPEYVLAWNKSNMIHFGKTCKLEYNAGVSLTPYVGNYEYIIPSQTLPKIIATNSGTGSIAAIKSFFTDEQVLQGICGYLGFNYDELLTGRYKLIIEPLCSFLYGGAPYTMTATEAALYDRQVNGNLRAWMGSLTHKNLPLALYLDKGDLGYAAWSGSKSKAATNDDIIASLGIGIVRFTEKPEEPPPVGTYDYEYRVNTEVITAVTVSGGQSDPDHPVSVRFNIGGTTYTVRNVYYPDGDSQLAWVKWRTPSKPCDMTIHVTVTGSGSTQGTIQCRIIDLDGNDPPNPVADDRNDRFREGTVPTNPQVTSASWGVWSPWWQEYWVDRGWWEDDSWTDSEGNEHYSSYWVSNWVDEGWWEFDYNSYSASLSSTMKITPDSLSPTATASTLKSGYGVQESVTARVTTSQSSAVTAAQNAVTYFPEFRYETYWRLLKSTVSGKSTAFRFKDNPYSTYNRPTHFTPIWYPDGRYTPYTWVLDCWTPTGMLSMNLTDTVRISGNLWEEWHIAPTR